MTDKKNGQVFRTLENLNSIALQRLMPRIIQSHQRLNELQQHIDTLERFYDEYLTQSRGWYKKGISTEEYKNIQQFLSSLKSSIVEQKRAHEIHLFSHRNLIAQQQRIKKNKDLYRKLFMQKIHQVNHEKELIEQKITDALACSQSIEKNYL
jgi:flagellar biosynthesis chaperone FliJ